MFGYISLTNLCDEDLMLLVLIFFNIDNLHISIHPIICWLLNSSMSTTLVYNDSPQYIYIHNVLARKSYISLTNLYDETSYYWYFCTESRLACTYFKKVLLHTSNKALQI